MSDKPISPAYVREARAFLRGRKIGMSPRKFAMASQEQGKTFSELLRFLIRLMQGSQNQSSQRMEIVRAAAGLQD